MDKMNSLQHNITMIRSLFATCLLLFAGMLHAQDLPPVDTFPPSPTVAQMRQNVSVLQSQAIDAAHKLGFYSDNKRDKRDLLDKLVKAAKKDSTFNRDTLAQLSTNLSEAKNLEKTAKNDLKKAEKAFSLAEKTMKTDSLTLLKNLPKLIEQVKEVQALAAGLPEPFLPPVASILIPEGVSDPSVVPKDSTLTTQPDSNTSAVAERPKKEKTKATSASLKTYDAAQDVMLNPPTPPCAVAQQRRDEFSGEVYRELKREEIFRHTPAVLKNYLSGKPQVTCDAAMSSTSGGVLMMHLWFKVNDPNPRKSFGTLGKDAITLLRFLDGTSVSITNMHADEGTPDPEGGPWMYHGQYNIDKALLKKLQKTPLDKIRIAWSTGYEDYDLYDIDVFIRQLKCLL